MIDTLKEDEASPQTIRPIPTEGVRDLFLDISPVVAADLLQRNEQVLHAQNLQQGKSAEQSKQELETLFQFLRQLTPVSLSSTRHVDRWVLELHGGWK